MLWFLFISQILLLSSSSQCSAQEQVFHCKPRHQGCRSAQRRVFHRKLRNRGCSFTRDGEVRQLPAAFLKYICSKFNCNCYLQCSKFFLSSDIRSEGSITIVKIFDYHFLMIFDSTSLPQSKNVFQKKCVCVCVCVCVCLSVCVTVAERRA